VISLGTGLGGSLATFRFSTPYEIDATQAQPVLQPLLESAGITRLRLGHADIDAQYPIASVEAVQPGESYVLIVEGLERAQLERRRSRIADAIRHEFEAQSTIETDTYQLAFAMLA
jgi:hypothetical protein